MMDDEKIIELFFERSEQALRELDQKYGKICYHFAYNIVNSREDAEECVNDAYLGAWNAIPPARPNPLLSYILKIVRNISTNAYWKKEAAKRNSYYTVALQEIEDCIADRKTVEDEADAKELAHVIEGFLDTLSSENRVIFMREDAECIKVSCRSQGEYSVNEICQRHFNGGGHRNAAGGDFYGTMDEALDIFFTILSEIDNEQTETNQI